MTPHEQARSNVQLLVVALAFFALGVVVTFAGFSFGRGCDTLGGPVATATN